MTKTSNNIDGRYILFPAGSAWTYSRIRDGEQVSATEEANLATHVAARDRLAWLGDLDMEALDELDDEPKRGDVLVACGYSRDADVAVCPVSRA